MARDISHSSIQNLRLVVLSDKKRNNTHTYTRNMVLELDIENQSRFQAIRPDLFADDTIDALALYINSSDTARPNSIISESIVDISSLRLYFGQIKNRNTLL